MVTDGVPVLHARTPPCKYDVACISEYVCAGTLCVCMDMHPDDYLWYVELVINICLAVNKHTPYLHLHAHCNAGSVCDITLRGIFGNSFTLNQFEPFLSVHAT